MTENKRIRLESSGLLAAFALLPDSLDEAIDKHQHDWSSLEKKTPSKLRNYIAFLRMSWLWLTAKQRPNLEIVQEFLEIRKNFADKADYQDLWTKIDPNFLRCREIIFIDILSEVSNFVSWRENAGQPFWMAILDHFQRSGDFLAQGGLFSKLEEQGLVQANIHMPNYGNSRSSSQNFNIFVRLFRWVKQVFLPGKTRKVTSLEQSLVWERTKTVVLKEFTERESAEEVGNVLDRFLYNRYSRNDPKTIINELTRRPETPKVVKDLLRQSGGERLLLAGALTRSQLVIVKRTGNKYQTIPCNYNLSVNALLDFISGKEWSIYHLNAWSEGVPLVTEKLEASLSKQLPAEPVAFGKAPTRGY